MRKILTAALILLFAGVTLYGQNYSRREKRFAENVLKKTVNVILAAQKTVQNGRVYTGDLAKAVRHQRFAKFLLENGKYDRAVRQSLRARQLAYAAMKANRARYRENFDRDERRIFITLNINDLDVEINRDMPRDRIDDRDRGRDRDRDRDRDRGRDRIDDRNRDRDRDERNNRDAAKDRDRDEKRYSDKDEDIVDLNIKVDIQ